MVVELISVGTEILLGNIVNTNAAYLAEKCALLGCSLYHQTVVGDNEERMEEAIRQAIERADIVILTGGLGPTKDDLTKEVTAKVFGRKLYMDEHSRARIRDYFEKIKSKKVTENNWKQALVPEGAIVIDNLNGTAPGLILEDKERGKAAILIPGPPNEMKPMFEQQVKPYLLKDSDTRLVSRTMHFFGIGESMLEDRLRSLMEKSLNPTVAPYAKTGEVQLRVTARVKDGEDPNALLEPVMEQIRQTVGEFLYGVDVGDLQTAVVRLLTEKERKVAVAESCTGGYLAKRITDVSGSSKVFECGVCSYSNRIKHQLLGVSEQTLAEYGAISEQTAAQMASGVRNLSGADIGISVTGNAGPTADEGKEVGLVYIGVDSPKLTKVFTLHVNRKDQDARETIRYLASSHALSLILKAAERL